MIYELLKCLFEFNNVVQVLFTIRTKISYHLKRVLVFILFAINSFFSSGLVIQLGSFFFSA